MSSVKIADTHDAVGDLTELQDLSVPLFSNYGSAEALSTEWHSEEGREIDGNRFDVAYGLPWVTWVFFFLTRDEVAFLMDTDNFSDEVTITTLDKRDNSYKNFNATYSRPKLTDESKFDNGFWYDVKCTFRDLQVIV